MKIHLSRAVIAAGLGAGLWLGSITTLAKPQQTKDKDQTQTATQTPSTAAPQKSAGPAQNTPVTPIDPAINVSPSI